MIITYAAFPGCLPEDSTPARHSSMPEAIRHLLEEAKDRQAEDPPASASSWQNVVLELVRALQTVTQDASALGDYGIGTPDGTVWYAQQAEEDDEYDPEEAPDIFGIP